MANSPDFIEHLIDLLRPTVRSVEARRMFGGHGLYADGLFIAIVAADAVYLRVDDRNRAEFDALELPPFEYRTKGGAGRMGGYRRAPDEALESAHAMAPWARTALGAALRAAAGPAGARKGTKATRRKTGPSRAGTTSARRRHSGPGG